MATRFQARKVKILEQLDTPEGEYHDLSPKGSVDAPIRDLISEINALDGLVTTSSCSGRISVFLEGRKTDFKTAGLPTHDEESRAGPGGKGGGGAWLYISHDPIDAPTTSSVPNFTSMFRLEKNVDELRTIPTVSCSYIHLKFEPMILHILSASMEHAQKILAAALAAGFRESGAVGLASGKTDESNPMVAVRSAGYSFDSIIGYQDEHGKHVPLVDENYLRILVQIANDRFRINNERIARFRTALLAAYHPSNGTSDVSKPDWEDSDARKRRKREEGLVRQHELRAEVSGGSSTNLTATAIDDFEEMFQ